MDHHPIHFHGLFFEITETDAGAVPVSARLPETTMLVPVPFSYIDMGGMFTILKVRENPDDADPSGWFAHPPGTLATDAAAEDLRADGIDTSVERWD